MPAPPKSCRVRGSDGARLDLAFRVLSFTMEAPRVFPEAPPMEPSVRDLCQLLARSRLLSPDEVRGLYGRWRDEAKGASADPGAFCRWAVARRYLTEYQAALLQRGKVNHFFLGPYKILERVGKGRMAGVYRAARAKGRPANDRQHRG